LLVTRILGDCPGCGRENSYGNVDVFGDRLVRGCGYCTYSVERPLPPIRKKILYLDQFFFSHAFRGNDEKFVEAAELIKQQVSNQVLAVPRSSLHELETLMWERRDELLEFIKATSRGAKVHPAYAVEQAQLLNAFSSWRSGGASTAPLGERDAIDSDVHKWDGYFRIDVGLQLHDADEVRHSKRQSIDNLVGLFSDWRKSKATFEEDVDGEQVAAGRAYVDAYATYAARIGTGDYSAIFDSPIISSIVETMMHLLGTDMPPQQRLRTCGDFFGSGHFKESPFQLLRAKLYAVLKDMVKRGAYTNIEKAKQRLSGFFYDVDHIATYAPYCDAILIDRQMARFVADDRVALKQTYGTMLFSRDNWDEFIDWLGSLSLELSNEHRSALDAING
jgi:hypothetical protein